MLQIQDKTIIQCTSQEETEAVLSIIKDETGRAYGTHDDPEKDARIMWRDRVVSKKGCDLRWEYDHVDGFCHRDYYNGWHGFSFISGWDFIALHEQANSIDVDALL